MPGVAFLADNDWIIHHPILSMRKILDLSLVDRETALRTWLAYHRIEEKRLADELGVHKGIITRIIKGERAPRELIARLIQFGVPPQLLPEPGPGPGRPPKPEK
ncbi:MAG: transcriptional regulator [Desulfovibrionaceae bacterium]